MNRREVSMCNAMLGSAVVLGTLLLEGRASAWDETPPWDSATSVPDCFGQANGPAEGSLPIFPNDCTL